MLKLLEREAEPSAFPPDGRGSSRVLPLQNGDMMDAREFRRRFKATKGLKKAELIDGVVYMHWLVSAKFHAEPDASCGYLLTHYRIYTPGVRGGSNGSLRIDKKNTPQPDEYLYIPKDMGGKAWLDGKGYLHGSPELIVEIAASSVSYDLNQKKDVYARVGVREYAVWRVKERAIDWFQLIDGKYEPMPREESVVRSTVMPGLWIDLDVLVANDLKACIATLELGLQTSEHAAFVEKLKG